MVFLTNQCDDEESQSLIYSPSPRPNQVTDVYISENYIGVTGIAFGKPLGFQHSAGCWWTNIRLHSTLLSFKPDVC